MRNFAVDLLLLNSPSLIHLRGYTTSTGSQQQLGKNGSTPTCFAKLLCQAKTVLLLLLVEPFVVFICNVGIIAFVLVGRPSVVDDVHTGPAKHLESIKLCD